MWILLQYAVARAGGFENLLPHLISGRIKARAAGFFTSKNEPRERADNWILSRWWEWQLREVDPAASQAWFELELGDLNVEELWLRDRYPNYSDLFPLGPTLDPILLAVGIEVDGAAVEALWPGAVTPVDASWPKVVAPVEALRSETSAPAPKHAGGRPPEHKWEVAASG